MDRKEIVVSTAAGLAVIAVGYLVWKHEQQIQAANAAAQADTNQQQIDEFSQQVQALQSFSSYGGASYAPNYGAGAAGTADYTGTASGVQDTGSTSLQTPANASSDLQKILEAFFPPQQSTPTPQTAATGAPSNDSTPNTPSSNPATSPAPSNDYSYIDVTGDTGTARYRYNRTLPTSDSSGTMGPSIYPVVSRSGAHWTNGVLDNINRGMFQATPIVYKDAT